MNGLGIGLLAVIAGAIMQGSFALPQKFVRNWPWEKSWLFYSLSGMVLFPWLLVALVVPNPAQAYANAGPGVLALTAIFGAGWGIGSVLFGLGIAALGVALGFAIIISLTAALGALVPMAVLEPAKFWGKPGALLVIGLAVVIAGVALCAKAGALKDTSSAAGGKRKFARGLAICIASGIASPMLNFAFNFGAPIQKEAAKLGASMNNASIAVFAVAISAGFLINAGYCLYLLGRNRTWGTGLPADRGRNLLYTLAMGCLWLFGFYFYGVGSTQLGDLGKVVGWPIFMTVMVVVANIWGLLTGEWKNADRRAFRYLGAGLALMVCALAIMAPALKS